MKHDMWQVTYDTLEKSTKQIVDMIIGCVVQI